jgi:hypothetical protein
MIEPKIYVEEEKPLGQIIEKGKPIELLQKQTFEVSTTTHINRTKREKIEVKVKENKKDVAIPLPVIVKDEKRYEVITQNEDYKKLFLKKDDDDPVIKQPDNFERVEKKKESKEA